MRSKVALGGGTGVVVGWGVYQTIATHPLSPKASVIVFLLAVISAQLWHGLLQFRMSHPRFMIRHPKQQLWDEPRIRGVGYYFEVVNPSEDESLESVKAELVSIDTREINNLPIPLHIRHKLYSTSETEVSIAPGGVAGFDIVTGPDNNPRSQQQVLVPCVMGGARGIVSSVPISGARCRMAVRVMAKNCPFQEVSFDVWVEERFLRCEPCSMFVMAAT